MAQNKEEIIGILAGAHPAHVNIFSNFTSSHWFVLGAWAPGRKLNKISNLMKYTFAGFKLALVSRPRAVLIEGISPSSIITLILRLFFSKAKIFALVAEDLIYKALAHPLNPKSMLVRWSFKKIDYVIAIGRMLEEQVQKLCPRKKVFVMYPSINSERFSRLSKLIYNPEANCFIQIGGGNPQYKGVDITLALLPFIRKKDKEAKLLILGYGAEDLGRKDEGLVLPGRVQDVFPYLEQSCLMIHPGRSDAFPVATLEAMIAGVPPMVSILTGTKEILEQIEPRLVRDLSVDDFQKGLDWFFRLTAEEKQSLSEKCRQRVLEFLEKELPESNQRSIKDIKGIIKGLEQVS